MITSRAVYLSTLTRPLSGQASWLFPGVLPGHPLSRKAFNDQLVYRGIHTRPARTAALIALAAELPGPVLADLLDVHIHTALKWAHHAQRDWSAYLAARTAAPEATESELDQEPAR